jgi:hypothetical protein
MFYGPFVLSLSKHEPLTTSYQLSSNLLTLHALRAINYGLLFSTSAPMNRGTSAGGGHEAVRFGYLLLFVMSSTLTVRAEPVEA